MDQRQLVAFATLSEELSFSRAAARLGITQPALSIATAKLEAELGVRLFDRTKRTVVLTAPGKIFLEETRRTLRQMDIAQTMVRRAGEGKLGRLTIGFVDTAPFNVLPTIVANVVRELPLIELVLEELVTSEQIEALAAGRIDVGLLRPMFQAEEFNAQLISAEPYVVAMHADHPLVRAGKVRLKDLHREHLITSFGSKRRYVEGRFRGPLAQAGVELTVTYEIQQIHAILGLVAGGLGVAFVPRSVAVICLPNVRFLEIAEARPPMSELMMASRKDDTNPIVKRVWTIVLRSMQANGADGRRGRSGS
jgi:DNA-binding transcriptional LysR family regulator